MFYHAIFLGVSVALWAIFTVLLFGACVKTSRLIILHTLSKFLLHNGILKYCVLLPILCWCFQNSFAQQVKKPSFPLPTNNSGTSFDSIQISQFFKKYPAVKSYARQTFNFYRQRKYTYAWFANGTLIKQANNLSSRMMDLQNDGVFKNIPYKKTLDSLLNSTNNKTDKKLPDITFELLLTSQYFFFAELAWQGMNTSVSQSVKWYLPRKKVSYDQYLDQVLANPNGALPANEPVYRQYGLLRKFLMQYRALDAKNNWVQINTGGKVFTPGDSSLAIVLIKKRLFNLGDYYGDTLNHSFSIALFTAIRQFQERYGLKVDGLPNKETVSALNVPLKNVIRQIMVNMERSRWLPIFLNTDYIAVNIPEFKLHVYHADSLLWSCEVVVGKAVHQTTIFYGEVKYVVFSPYWNVPPSIVRNEILPGINRSSHYLAEHNMEITGHEGGLPVVRQKPGPENSLGLVKFLFPNSYNIYLHDTPSKSLFNDSTRAFSHGCIRVQEPAKLAAFLLKNDKAWDSSKISIAMHSGKEQYDTLTNKVPVFIAYFTAFTDRDNRLNFKKDIYHLDEKLAALLSSGKGIY
jgi:murein L,D-transpeptidase YcbB/YkuD